MKKLAYIGFGHNDVSLPYLKYLNQYFNIEIDYYMILSKQYQYNPILDLSNLNLEPRIYFPDESKNIIPAWINQYFEDKINIYLIIYPSIKIWSIKSHLFFFTFINHLHRNEYDLIHITGTNLFNFRLLYSFQLRNIKKICTIHDWENHSGEGNRFKLAGKIHRFLAKNKFPMIFQNKKDFEIVKKQYKKNKNIFYCPFGILDFYHLLENIPMPSSDILFFGRISKYKGIPTLLKSYKSLLDKNDQLMLCIAGEGQIDYPLSEIPATNIIFINRFISNEELASLLRNTKIVVCPYTDATQSGVLVTAQTFNRVVIASDVGGFRDILINGLNGFLIQPNDNIELEEKIEYLLKDDNYKLFEDNIKSYFESGPFSWREIALNMFDIYKTIIKQK